MNLPENVEEPYGFTVYWRIENFDSEPSENFCVYSEIFNNAKMNSNWQICIHVRDYDNLVCFIQKKSNPVPFVVHYSISFLSSSGWTISQRFTNKFRIEDPLDVMEFVDLLELRRRQWFHLPNGSLTIRFHLWNEHVRGKSSQCLMISRLRRGNRCSLWHRPMQFFSHLKPSDMLSFPLSYDFCSNINQDLQNKPNEFHNKGYIRAIELKSQDTQTETHIDFQDSDELIKVFKEEKFSFVTLRTSDRDFSVHKAVLCAKSPIFKAMFESQMKENDSKIVDIDDVDSQTMASLIKFLHLEPLGVLKGDAIMELYYAAEKYQIDPLMVKCVSLLKNGLTVETVCDALVLADLYQDTDLMNCAKEYFCRNSKVILCSRQWINILDHTELVEDVLRKLTETTL